MTKSGPAAPPGGGAAAGRGAGRGAFEAEVGVLARLRHPGVVAFYGAAEDAAGDGSLYVVLEFCGGGDLAGYYRTPAFGSAEFGRVGAELLQSLGYLHGLEVGTAFPTMQLLQYVPNVSQKNTSGLTRPRCVPKVAHRDLKPENVLLDAACKVGEWVGGRGGSCSGVGRQRSM